MKLGSIQALRGVAALMVVSDHVPRLESKLFPDGIMHGAGAAGAIGVDLFFVISGFIMMTTTRNTFGAPNATQSFLARRFVRIYPAYWFALAPFLIISRIFPVALFVPHISFATVVTSTLLIPYSIGPLMFVAWSLEFEVYFYLVFAVALRFARAHVRIFLLSWLAITLVFNALSRGSDSVFVQFVGSPLALEFIGGCAIGLAILHGKIVAPRTALLAGAVLATVVALYSSRYDGFASFELAWFRVLAAGPAMMLLVYGAVGLEERTRREPPRFAVAIGDASYTMYLWHGMLVGVFTSLVRHLHPHGRLADACFLIGAFWAVIVGSLVVYRIIELPLTRAAGRVIKVGRKEWRVAIPAP